MRFEKEPVAALDWETRVFNGGKSAEVTLLLTPSEKRASLLVAAVTVDGFELIESARVNFDAAGGVNREVRFQLHHHRVFAGEKYHLKVELFGGDFIQTLEKELSVTAEGFTGEKM